MDNKQYVDSLLVAIEVDTKKFVKSVDVAIEKTSKKLEILSEKGSTTGNKIGESIGLGIQDSFKKLNIASTILNSFNDAMKEVQDKADKNPIKIKAVVTTDNPLQQPGQPPVQPPENKPKPKPKEPETPKIV